MSITVVGSINLDIGAQSNNYPMRGQTIFGKSVEYLPGGKGANQATAVAKLGKKVQLIGAVGQDMYGDFLINSLKENNVDIRFIKKSNAQSTGTSIVITDRTGENTILVFKGANNDLTVSHIENCFDKLEESKILLIQMEIPKDTVIRAMQLAKEKGMFVILDPAPAEGITVEALDYADIITPNQQETEHILGIQVKDKTSALAAAKAFEKMGVRNSIIKMGEEGSIIYQSGNYEYIEPIKVDAVDTLGAGDAFAGALACAIQDGLDLVTATKKANIVGGLKVSRVGAQAGIPTKEELENFCKERNLSKFC